MRLAFCLFHYFPFGGLQRDFLKIAKECQSRGHEIHVFVMDWEGEVPSGFIVHHIKVNKITNHQACLNYAKQVKNKLKEQTYDCVIGFNKIPGLDFYFAADGCFQAKARKDHGFLYRLTSRYKTFLNLEKSVFEKEYHCKIGMLNEAEKMNFSQYYKTQNDRFCLLPPGVEEDRVWTPESKFIASELREEFSISEEDYLLLMVASDFETKGLSRCMEAIAALPKEKLLRTHFFIVGDGKSAAYVSLAKKLKIEHHLVFLGSREDLSRFYMAADILLHPAHTENAGKVLLEALACGLPTLTTANCGYAYHIQRANSGVILPMPFSQKECNQKLVFMLEDDARRLQWKKHALSYASSVDLFSMVCAVADTIERLC